MSKILPVVLCGGSGSRLWPISRRSLPKQFAHIIGNKSLLQLTFERIAHLTNDSAVMSVANQQHRFLVEDAAHAAKIFCKTILEPVERNTTAAMALAAFNTEPKQVLLFVPADHYIPDTKSFAQTITKGIVVAQQGAFVVFGVKPSMPHCGYGYIQIENAKGDCKPVKSFTEKPTIDTAKSYISSGNYYWNSGIFLVRADTLLASIQQYAMDIYQAVQLAVEKQTMHDECIFIHSETFDNCRAQSIDYAVLEHHTQVTMVSFQGIWSDVGSWQAVAELTEPNEDNNRITGCGITYDATSTYIRALHRPVVALGTRDILIVDTDDALLVTAKSHVEQVKNVVAKLQHEKLPQAIEHRHAIRPWGKYTIVDEDQFFKVKRITVKPGASLSLQLHRYRAEHWIVVTGTAKVTCGEEKFILKENQSTYIPLGVKHRLSNPGTIPLEIIEVQSGSYLGEDDIERFEDKYGRLINDEE